MVAALQVLSVICDSGKKASETLNLFELAPQILKNIKFDASKGNPLAKEEVQNFIQKKSQELGNKGRILVRKSGTENLIRIMAEGENENEITRIVDEIVTLLLS